MTAIKSKDENKNSYEELKSDETLLRGKNLKSVESKHLDAARCANPKKETVEYISGMIVELRAMADSADQVLLVYLLDMAYEESVVASKKV
jgi:hypothetical protein